MAQKLQTTEQCVAKAQSARAEAEAILVNAGLPGNHPILDALMNLISQYGGQVLPLLLPWLLRIWGVPIPPIVPPAPAPAA